MKFDGKTEASDGRYTAKDGVLVVNPQDAARGPRLRQLSTTQEFPKDFILKLEFRAEVNADSGIFLRKPQLQCRDYLVAGPYKNLKNYKPQDWNVIEVDGERRRRALHLQRRGARSSAEASARPARSDWKPIAGQWNTATSRSKSSPEPAGDLLALPTAPGEERRASAAHERQ